VCCDLVASDSGLQTTALAFEIIVSIFLTTNVWLRCAQACLSGDYSEAKGGGGGDEVENLARLEAAFSQRFGM